MAGNVFDPRDYSKTYPSRPDYPKDHPDYDRMQKLLADLSNSTVNDVASGLSEESKKENDNKELAEEFGKAVVENQKEDLRHNPDLDALMNGPSQTEPYKKPPGDDLRYNPDLDELFGVPRQVEDTSAITDILSSFQLDNEKLAELNLGALIDGIAALSKSIDANASNNNNTAQTSPNANNALNSLSVDIGNPDWLKSINDLINVSAESGSKNTETYGPFLPDKNGNNDKNEPADAPAAPVVIGGGFDSCCEMLAPLFETLSESINSLTEAVNKFADTLDPKEKLTEEEKEEKEYNKQTGSLWEMFSAGVAHQYNAENKEGEKAPGKFAKELGEKAGGMSGGKMAGIGEALAGGTGMLSAFMGGIGAVGGALTGLYSVVKNSAETIVDWNETLMRSNFQFAEFSASMSKVQAEMEVRDIMYSQQRGDARSESAEGLAESWSELKTAFAPIADFFANTFNEILTVINKVLKFLIETFGFTGGEGGRSSLSDALVRSALEPTADAYGAPARMAIFGR